MKQQQLAGKKRWEGKTKEQKSQEMKKIRGSIDFSKIELPIKPQDVKREMLEEMGNQTEKGVESAVLLSLSDKKARTEKEISTLVERIAIVAVIELFRRDGLLEITENFDWFTNWSAKKKVK